jgi:ATP synthase F1 complex assembly factor 2
MQRLSRLCLLRCDAVGRTVPQECLLRSAQRSLVTAERPKPLKRFYQEASVKQVSEKAWCVMLDSKALKTPKRTDLHLPSQPLAAALAEEWASQIDKVNPHDMPITTLACTAVDLVRPDPGGCISRMLPYLSSDTVCFEDDQERLAELQTAEWGPLREWFEARFGVKLRVAQGLGVPNHDEGTEQAVGLHLALRDEWELCALEVATNTAKSLVVAAALIDKPDTTAEDARRWALLEEFYQIERWGLVEGEHDVSHAECLRWYAAIHNFISERRRTGASE